MSQRRMMLLAFFLVIVVLFFFANRAAYKAYFSGDDLDKLGWPTLIPSEAFIHQLVTPQMSPDLFRPVGYLYYRFMGRTFHLTYWPYVAVLQAGHIVNVILLFFLLRRLDFPDFAACAGSLLYIFHAAVIDAFWQPQFIFEVLACMLSLIAMLLYARGRWILALIPFWLAYKSKEIVVTLPLALLAYEMFLGSRKWKRLIPYFLISLNFGLQALWINRHASLQSGYVLRFTPQILWHAITFYASAIAFLPFAGFALLLLPVFVRDRRLYVGCIFTISLFLPMLALPGRLESVYWYIPLVGLTIVFAAVVSRLPRWTVALFFVIWLPINYSVLRERRRSLLTIGDQNRWYTTGLVEYARHVPPLKAVVYKSTPLYLGSWGVEGAIHQAFGFGVDAVWYKDPRAQEAMRDVPLAIVSYDPPSHVVRGMLRTRNESYIRFNDELPEPQFGTGWYNQGEALRWIAPRAEAVLYRPADAAQFEIVASVPPENLEREGPSRVTVLEDGRPLGTAVLSVTGAQTLHWQLGAAGAGDKRITIICEPVRHGGAEDQRALGIAVASIGYLQAP